MDYVGLGARFALCDPVYYVDRARVRPGAPQMLRNNSEIYGIAVLQNEAARPKIRLGIASLRFIVSVRPWLCSKWCHSLWAVGRVKHQA
jgi:hypothetical protein